MITIRHDITHLHVFRPLWSTRVWQEIADDAPSSFTDHVQKGIKDCFYLCCRILLAIPFIVSERIQRFGALLPFSRRNHLEKRARNFPRSGNATLCWFNWMSVCSVLGRCWSRSVHFYKFRDWPEATSIYLHKTENETKITHYGANKLYLVK